MLLKCCTQYVSKIGKHSSGHRSRKGQFSFQTQRRVVQKNVQTTVQLLSSHMLARLCSKSFKPGFSSTWSENFQMCKLDFKEAEEPEIKFPTFVGSREKEREFQKKTSTSFSLSTLKPLTVWITRNWKILKKRKYQTTLCIS